MLEQQNSPTISSVSPSSKEQGSTGFWLYINGRNFSSSNSYGYKVNLGSGITLKDDGMATVVSSSQIKVYITSIASDAAAGYGYVSVIYGSGANDYFSLPDAFYVEEANVGTITTGEDTTDKTIQDSQSVDSYDPIREPSLVAEPIDVSTGAHLLNKKIMSVQGAIKIAFELSYNSLNPMDSVVGYGWCHSHSIALVEGADNTVYVMWPSQRLTQYQPNGGGTYTNVNGDPQDVLIKNGNGAYTLTDKNLSVYDFNSAGQLITLTNRKGFKLNYTYQSNQLASLTEPISRRHIDFTYNAGGYLATISADGCGTASLSYDASHNLVEVTDPLGHDTLYMYNADHRIVIGVNELGITFFTNTYDSEGRVIEQDDALSSTPTGKLAYDTNDQGNYVSVYTDRNRNDKAYEHSSQYRLIGLADELGNIKLYTYDSYGNRSAISDESEYVNRFIYDERGNLTKKIDTKNNETDFTYDANNNLLSIKDADGNETLMEYDSNNNLIKITDPPGNVTRYTYNSDNLLETVTNPRGGVTIYTYTNGQLYTITDPTGVVTRYEYDDAGRGIKIIDSDNNTRTKTYDLMGRLLSETDALGNSVAYQYDDRGRLIQMTDARGSATIYEYDNNDNLIEETDALGQSTEYQYDGEGRLLKVIDARGITVKANVYDARGQKISETDATGNTVKFSYDARGNLISITDARDKKTNNSFDSLNLLLRFIDPLNNEFNYSYNDLGLKTEKTDPLSIKTEYKYDSLKRHIQTVGSSAIKASQSFDADGNVASLLNSNDNGLTFDYDAAGRLTKITYADGASVTKTYNNRGLVSQLVNGRGQTADYTYDAANRLISVSDQTGIIDYTYDNNGNLFTVADSVGTITREYDNLNRVIKFNDVFGNLIQYSYDEVGNIIGITYPGNKKVTYTYDDDNRLTKVTDWAGRETAYTYDANNRLTQIHNADSATVTMTYDVAGRITKYVDTSYHFDYTYDSAGRLVAEEGYDFGVSYVLNVELTYDDANRIATYNGAQVDYDQDGNMISGPSQKGTSTYTFDSRNRLTAMGGLSYTCDAEGRRVSVTQDGNTTRYVVNPNSALSQVLMETTPAGEVIAYYVYGLGLLGRETADGAYHTYHYDYRGSTVALTDLTGAVTDRYYYDPFGALVSSTGETSNPFLYNGRDGVMTDENGLYYMRARYYNPMTKTFISRDPLIGNINRPLSLNLYAYVEGNPVMLIDPIGMASENFQQDVKRSPVMMIDPSGLASENFQQENDSYLMDSIAEGLIGYGLDSLSETWKYLNYADRAIVLLSNIYQVAKNEGPLAGLIEMAYEDLAFAAETLAPPVIGPVLGDAVRYAKEHPAETAAVLKWNILDYDY